MTVSTTSSSFISIRTGRTGDDQQCSFQNATLTVCGSSHPAWRDRDGVAVSISLIPNLPDHVLRSGAECDVAHYLRDALAPLAGCFEIEVEIGPNTVSWDE